MATAPAGESHGEAAAPLRWWAPRITPVSATIAVATVLALGLRVYYAYAHPGFLMGVNEYDDGPYFGSAVRLVHGALPYRDFVLVQPPGITLLMTPAALVSYLTGTAWGLAIGRVLTMLSGAAAVLLAGLLVRHRGLLAVLVTCGILAIYPDGVAAAHTVLVEPWLVLFCLAGALAAFDGDRLASTRRLLWGGVAFGFAGAVEAWAIVPVIVVLALCLPSLKRAAAFAGGVAAGFLAPVLPFFAASPKGFYQSLITAQIGYRAHAQRVSFWPRLRNMLGLINTHTWGRTSVALAALVVLALIAAGLALVPLTTRRLPSALEWFAVATGGLVVAMFLWPPQFHYHFSAFFAPFLALAIALSLSRLVAGGGRAGVRAGSRSVRVTYVTALAGLALVAMATYQAIDESTANPVIGPVPAAVDRIIPRGACVVSDQVSITLAANRFVSSVPGCPLMVDTLGTDLAYSHGLKPSTGAAAVPAVAAVWRTAFHHAQYMLLAAVNARRIAWTPALRAYLATNFTEVFKSAHLTLYARKGPDAR